MQPAAQSAGMWRTRLFGVGVKRLTQLHESMLLERHPHALARRGPAAHVASVFLEDVMLVALRRLGRIFYTGVIVLLPAVLTIAVVVWVADFLVRYLGPDTRFGAAVQRLGLSVDAVSSAPYLIGSLVVLAIILLVGLAAEAGAKGLFTRLFNAVLNRIPLVNSVYGTSQQLMTLLDGAGGKDKLKGMQAVRCRFGKEAGCSILALRVSPERFTFDGVDHQVVIIPTAPVPIGGALLFVPADEVQPTDLSVEKLMSIYVSMGVTAPQFLPVRK